MKHQGLSIARQQRGWSCCCSTLQVQPTGEGWSYSLGCQRWLGCGDLVVWGFFLVAGITKLKGILLEDVEVPELEGLVGLVPSVALPAENTFALWMFLNIVDLLSDIFSTWKILIPLLKLSVPQFLCSLSAELEFSAGGCKAPVTPPVPACAEPRLSTVHISALCWKTNTCNSKALSF